VISDSGPIFSLEAIIDKLEILNEIFEEISITKAVWEEITRDNTKDYHLKINIFSKIKSKRYQVLMN